MKEKIYSLLSSILTPSLIIFIVSYFIVWGYWSRLGRLDVFYDVFDVKNMAGLIIISSLISLVGLLCVFFIVSWLVPAIIPVDNDYLLTYDEIKKGILFSLMFGGLFPPLFIVFMTRFFNESMTLSLPLSLMFLSLIIYLTIYVKYNREISRDLNNKIFKVRFYNKFRLYFVIPIFGAFIAHCQVFPTSILVKYLKFPDGINDFFQIVIFVLIYSVLYFSCLVPCAMFLMLNKKEKLLSRIFLPLCSSLSIILCMSVYFTVIPVMFLHSVVKMSGISDFTAHYFILDDKKIPVGLFKKEIWGTTEIKNSDIYKIHAADLFSFGSIRLLCTPSILPVYKRSWDFFPGNTSADEIIGDSLKEVAQTCVSLNKKDVQRWDVAVE